MIPRCFRKTTMTRISSFFVAPTLAILPISAFAQQTAALAQTAEAAGIMTTAPNAAAPASSNTTTTTTAQPAKPDVNTSTPGAKTAVHGMNTVTTPSHAKANIPTKAIDLTKS
jgi:hypothetical protein